MKLFFIILFSVLFFSCSKKESNEIPVEKVKIIRIDANLVFPDTIKLNTEAHGYIQYRSEFDEYTKAVNQSKGITRLIDFNYTLDSLKIENDSILETKVIYRNAAFDSRKIELTPINFKRKGVFYIQGVIKDLVIFDTIEDLSTEIAMDGLEQKFFIRKKVVVID